MSVAPFSNVSDWSLVQGSPATNSQTTFPRELQWQGRKASCHTSPAPALYSNPSRARALSPPNLCTCDSFRLPHIHSQALLWRKSSLSPVQGGSLCSVHSRAWQHGSPLVVLSLWSSDSYSLHCTLEACPVLPSLPHPSCLAQGWAALPGRASL